MPRSRQAKTDTNPPQPPQKPQPTPVLKPPLPMVMEGTSGYAARLRANLTYLQQILPENSQSLFLGHTRKYGRHLGIPIQCPACDARPPHYIPQHARWRWMAFHQMTAHRRNGTG